MLTLFTPGKQHKIKTWKFPAGEVGVSLDVPDSESYTIKMDFEGSDDIQALIQVADIIHKQNHMKEYDLTLFMPYLPYGRQDRYMNPKESYALKGFASTINALCFDGVVTLDPHNVEVYQLLFNNAWFMPQESLVKAVPTINDYDYLIAPDAGAAKKLKGDNVITLSKTRGAIGEVLYNPFTDVNLDGKKLLVVDDICDGGATFNSLAAMLFTYHEVSQLDLYVTHGIFSRGLAVLASNYDTIYTANLMNKQLKTFPHPDLKEIINANPTN